MLLSGPMVRAFLEGRKTKTRRLSNQFNAQPGDRIWFKETFHRFDNGDIRFKIDFAPYCQSSPPFGKVVKWTPSIFMPKSICRYWSEVLEVRQEPLHDITSEDVLDEGIPIDGHKCGCERCAYTSELCPGTQSSLICAYAQLWDSLNKKPGTRWADNPTVFVFTFRRLTEQQIRFQKFK